MVSRTYICFRSLFYLVEVFDFTIYSSGKVLLFSMLNSWKICCFQSNFPLWCSQKYIINQPIVLKLYCSNLCVLLLYFRDLKGTCGLRIFRFRLTFESENTCFGVERRISTHNWRLAPPKLNAACRILRTTGVYKLVRQVEAKQVAMVKMIKFRIS